MKKRIWHLVISLVFLIVATCSYAQNLDLIVTLKGDSIACHIDSISETRIYFEMKSQSIWKNTHIELAKVSQYEKNVIKKGQYLYESGTSIIKSDYTMANAKYKISKTMYDYKTWTHEEGDPYNPTTCGILSIIPGVGQMVAHEYGRGAAFLGGFAGCLFLSFVGGATAMGSARKTEENKMETDEPQAVLGIGLMLAGLAGAAAIDIYSVVDAVRVAKVNNLVWRDKMGTGFNLQMEPYFSPIQTCGSTKAQLGLSLKVKF